jgi:hypothetical protein
MPIGRYLQGVAVAILQYQAGTAQTGDRSPDLVGVVGTEFPVTASAAHYSERHHSGDERIPDWVHRRPCQTLLCDQLTIRKEGFLWLLCAQFVSVCFTTGAAFLFHHGAERFTNVREAAFNLKTDILDL